MDGNYVIVVGVDGSEGGRRALTWAVNEAHGRGGTVQAIMAWRWDDPQATGAGEAKTEQELRESAEQALAHEIAALPEYWRSGVPIATEVIEGRAAEVLSNAAHDANLLVLGSHGHSRAWHTVLGSVTEECVAKATCPVVVIPAVEPARPAEDLATR